MNNYKIKVNNEAESREAQELFFELGYGWYEYGKKASYLQFPFLYAEHGDTLLFGQTLKEFNTEENQEITLPQLRALVSEQQMASHNIEQQELKANPKLFLDPTQNYAEIEWDGTFFKPDYLIEVPNGAVEARINGSGGINFINANDDYMNDATGGEWVGTHRGKHDIVGHTIVWQRTQDEPFLTPESVIKREVNHKNVVQKANEFFERLKRLEYQLEATGSSASGSINLMPRNSAESIRIQDKIKSELDSDSELEKALDVQIGGNHYKSMKIQPVEFALANNLDFCQGSAIKYILRHAEKGGKQDLEKAKHFIDLMIQHCYG